MNNVINGSYTLFGGIPVVRENNVICCGDNRDKYVMVLMILSTKKIRSFSLSLRSLLDFVYVMKKGQMLNN